MGVRLLAAFLSQELRIDITHSIEGSGFALMRPKADCLVDVRSGGYAAVLVSDEDGSRWAGTIADLRSGEPGISIIFVALRSSEALAIQALRSGVREYVKWPEDRADLVSAIRRCIPEATENPGNALIGVSRQILAIQNYVALAAPADCNVLVTGETGTGKELVAQEVHRLSMRARGPLACINCAAIPDTLFESELFGYERGAFTGAQAATTGKLEAATGGTVFFDEVGELSQFAQAKLLRAIDHREIYRLGGNRRFQLDIRVVAATNRDLEAMVRENQFRRDLYFRLNVATVHIPPLRERREDIPALVRHFLPDLNRRFRRRVAGLTSESMEHFLSYDWPGNIRELRNVLEAAFVVTRSSHISWTEMPESFRRTCDRMMPSPPTEREALVNALRASRWNKTEAAGRLHWSRMTLYRKMSKYDVLDNADSDDL